MLRGSVSIAQSEPFKEQIEAMEARLSVNNEDSLGDGVTLIENKGRGVKVWFYTLQYLLSYFLKRLWEIFPRVSWLSSTQGNWLISEQQRIGRRSTPYISHLLLQIQSKAVLVSYEIQSFCPFRDQDDNIFSIDATYESGRYGRLLNHSKLNPNCLTKVVTFSDIPRLIFVAKYDIVAGTELLYDYGDRCGVHSM